MRSEQRSMSERYGHEPWATAHRKEGFSRLQVLWALASAFVLLLCWDAALRLDERVSVPRVRMAHALDESRLETGW